MTTFPFATVEYSINLDPSTLFYVAGSVEVVWIFFIYSLSEYVCGLFCVEENL